MARSKKSVKKFAKRLPDVIKKRRERQKVERIRGRKKTAVAVISKRGAKAAKRAANQDRRLPLGREGEGQVEKKVSDEENKETVVPFLEELDSDPFGAADEEDEGLQMEVGEDGAGDGCEREDVEDDERVAKVRGEMQRLAKKTKGATSAGKPVAEDRRPVVTEQLLARLTGECQKSVSGLKMLVLAYRSACHFADEADEEDGRTEETRGGYCIPNGTVFKDTVTFCLSQLKGVFRTAAREDEVRKCLDSFLESTAHLVAAVAPAASTMGSPEKAIEELALRSLAENYSECLSLGCNSERGLSEAQRRAIRTLVSLWSSSQASEAVRVLAFNAIFQSCLVCKRGPTGLNPLLTTCLCALYISYVREAQFAPRESNVFMRRCVAELCRLDPVSASQVVLAHLAQLSALVNSSEGDSHDWLFVNALELWLEVVCFSVDMPLIRRLRFPIIQLLTTVLNGCFGPRLLPLRLRLVRMILCASEMTGAYANPTPALLQALELTENKAQAAAGKNSASPPDLRNLLSVPKELRGTPALREAVLVEVHELLLRWLSLNSYSIAFPEMALPITVFVKRLLAEAGKERGHGLRLLSTLLEKTVENTDFVEAKRSAVEFGPRDVDKVKQFLETEKEKKGGGSPLRQAWTRYQQRHETAPEFGLPDSQAPKPSVVKVQEEEEAHEMEVTEEEGKMGGSSDNEDETFDDDFDGEMEDD